MASPAARVRMRTFSAGSDVPPLRSESDAGDGWAVHSRIIMPTYAYQAVDGSGKRLRGNAQAVSSGALTRTLEERGLFVLDVAESAEGAAGRRGFRFGRRREVLEVTRALAALLPVGMPLAQALNAASGVASGDVRAALTEIR